jgi:ribosomal protein L37AE/L43A
MLTPAGMSLGTKIVAWAKRTILFGKRIATLEARLAAIEDALAKQPADACPFCGERAMRMTHAGHLLGDQGRQWWEDVWTCEKCGKAQPRRHKL